MRKRIANSDTFDNTSDTVTVLKVSEGMSATKTFQWDGSAYLEINKYNAGTWFNPVEYTVCDIYDLSQLLTEVEAEQDSLIIRGKLHPDAPSKERVRRMKNPDNGKVWFEEYPRRWVMIDIDGVDLPNWADPIGNPVRIVKFLIKQLPNYFHGRTCHWQMSSSAGVKPDTEARVHLWYWTNRTLGQEELKLWSEDFDVKVDKAVFNTVQPLFVARPKFVGGDDPLPQRSGLLKGYCKAVSVPVIDLNVASRLSSGTKKQGKNKPGKVASPSGTGMSFTRRVAVGFENKLALLGDAKGLEGFNFPLTSAIAAYVSEHGSSNHLSLCPEQQPPDA